MRIAWVFGRLREMTPAEIPFRAAEQVRRRADRRWRPRPLDAGLLASPLPRFPVDRDGIAAMPGLWRESIRADARALLRDGFTLLGAWRPARARTDWRLDPGSGERWPDVPAFDVDLRGAIDVKPAWELGRLQHLQILALAAALGDTEAGEAVAEDLSAWLADHPPARGIAYAAGVEIACRIVSWLVITALIDLPDSLRAPLWRALHDHGRWLARHPSLYSSANNHRIAELAALATLGALAPALPEAEAWREEGFHGLAELLPALIGPDGVGAEHSPSYQAWTMEWCLVARRALGSRWQAPDVDDRLLAGADFLAALLDRDGHAPAIGDDDGTVVLRQRLAPDRVALSIAGATGAALGRPDVVPRAWRPDVRALLLGLEGIEPRYRPRSRTFAGGYTVLSSRAAGHERLVVFDHGPLGFPSLAAHGHADALSVWVHVDGRPLVADGGTWRYTGAPDWRAFLRGTAAHPTIEVSGRDQSAQRGAFGWATRARASREAVRLGSEGGEVAGDHDGYAVIGVRHRRLVRLDRDVLVVEDTLEGRGEVRARLIWPFAPGLEVASREDSWEVRREGRVVATVAVRGVLRGRVARQDASPAPGVHAPAYGVRVAAPTLVFEGWVPLPAAIRTVFRFPS